MHLRLSLDPTTDAVTEVGNLNAAVVAAIIAAVASLVTIAFTVQVAARNRRFQSAHDAALKRIEHELSGRQKELEFRRKQLDDFYGKVYMLRHSSDCLRRQLPGLDSETGKRWRLVSNIAAIKEGSDPKLTAAVVKILDIDQEIATLMTAAASLHVYFPPRPSFTKFVEHVALLKLYWDQGRDQDPNGLEPFPDELDADLSNDIEFINHRLKELLSPVQ